jgi:hypothetical protein
MQEIITNHIDPSNNSGQIRHRWVNPETHWGELVEIRVDVFKGRTNHIHLSYGCGGWNKDATEMDVVYAMSRALQLAGDRLKQLYEEREYEHS